MELLRKHKYKIIDGVLVVCAIGGFIAKMKHSYSWLTRRWGMKQEIAKSMEQLFEAQSHAADSNYDNLIGKFQKQIAELAAIEETTEKLRGMRSSTQQERNSDEERALWLKLKCSSFAKTFTTIYISGLVDLMNHVQLTIISRRQFLCRISQNYSVPDAMMRVFLSHFEWILDEQVQHIYNHVYQSLKEELEPVELFTQFTETTLVELLSKLRNRIELAVSTTGIHALPCLMLPTTRLLQQATNSLPKEMFAFRQKLVSLYDEYGEAMSSSGAFSILTQMNDVSFDAAVEFLRSQVFSKKEEEKLTTIMVKFSQLSHLYLNPADIPHRKDLKIYNSVDAFCSVLYSAPPDF